MPSVKIPIPQNTLDFLRGVAAVYVVINHSRGAFYAGGEKILAASPTLLDRLSIAVLQLTSLGVGAVILFFALSGFAMAHSVAMSTSAGRFYLKRIVRIWPPYIAACLFAAAVATTIGLTGPHLTPAIFYLDTNSALTPQFWSLPFEVLFYLLCPLVLRSRRATHIFFAAASAALVLTLVTRGLLLNPYSRFLLNFAGNEAFFFAVGGMAYYHVEYVPTLGPRPLAGAVAVLFLAAWASIRMIGDNSILMCAALLAVAVLLIRNLPRNLAFSRWNIGYFSYSIYLYHYAVIAAIGQAARSLGIEPLAIRNPVVWVGVVPLAVGVSYALYQITERQSNRLVSLLRSNPQNPVLPPDPDDGIPAEAFG